jgi:Cdc6-like AAA superfamily ATPase
MMCRCALYSAIASFAVFYPSPISQATDTLETVRRRLHTCETPQRLPCRDAEYQRVREFLRQFLNTGFSQCMYISGVPGTGKTATVLRVRLILFHPETGLILLYRYRGGSVGYRRVLHLGFDLRWALDSRAASLLCCRVICLQLQAIRDLQKADKHDFTFIETNAMRLPDPKHFYVEVFRAVCGRAIAKRIAARQVEIVHCASSRFNDPDAKIHIFLARLDRN